MDMFLIVLPDISTDDALLEALHRKGRDAVIPIYEQYFPPLYQYVRLRVGDRALAQDIVSEVFLRLIASLGGQSAPHSHLRGWLFRVARNEIYRTYGKTRQLPITDLEEWMPAPPESDPDVHFDDTFDLNRVRHALRMLAAEHQEVLILRFGQRLNLQETADILGKSVSAVKSLQFRALDTLRRILLEPNSEAANG
jgi:RNA polymerase sigma-70 factor (ECF subfamily)